LNYFQYSYCMNLVSWAWSRKSSARTNHALKYCCKFQH
jgi:hypothetical protein